MARMFVKPLPDGKFLCTVGKKEYIYTAQQVINSWHEKVLVSNVGPAPIMPF